jgi:hypothetical protein
MSKFAIFPSAARKGSPKFSMPLDVREILIASIDDRDMFMWGQSTLK